MTTWEIIAEKSKTLPAEQQREVLDFVEFLRGRHEPKRPLRDLAGLWKGFDLSPTPSPSSALFQREEPVAVPKIDTRLSKMAQSSDLITGSASWS